MPLEERVYSVLLVSAADRFTTSLRALLPELCYHPVRVAGSVNEAQRLMQERAFDLAIINAPLPDDLGARFAVQLCARQDCAPLLLVRNDQYDEACASALAHGVFTLRKPTSTPMMLQALDWLRAARERLRRLEVKTMSLEEKMAEIRLVNHAKWVLIESCKMTEPDAHRFIEKQAMDRCVTRREIAEGVLRTYR